MKLTKLAAVPFIGAFEADARRVKGDVVRVVVLYVGKVEHVVFKACVASANALRVRTGHSVRRIVAIDRCWDGQIWYAVLHMHAGKRNYQINHRK